MGCEPPVVPAESSLSWVQEERCFSDLRFELGLQDIRKINIGDQYRDNNMT